MHKSEIVSHLSLKDSKEAGRERLKQLYFLMGLSHVFGENRPRCENCISCSDKSNIFDKLWRRVEKSVGDTFIFF